MNLKNRKLLIEAIRSMTKTAQFSWKDLQDIEADESLDISEMINDVNWYARTHLEKLGSGMARNVFLLNSRYVLKVAADRTNGIDQNKTEIQISSSTSLTIPLARVKRHSAKFVWLVSDLVRPINDEQEFVKYSGYDSGELREILDGMKSDDDDGITLIKSDFDKFVWDAWMIVKSGKLAIIDVSRAQHWGVTPDQKLVLLDYGYTQEMFSSVPKFMQK